MPNDIQRRVKDRKAGTLQARGLANPPRRLASRCYHLDVRIPNTFEAFESQIENWISHCVASRTPVRGVPIHRERNLVPGNESLARVWELVRQLNGQRTRIMAEYEFGEFGDDEFGVKEVNFSVPTKFLDFSDQPQDVRVSRPKPTEKTSPLNELMGILLHTKEHRPRVYGHTVNLEAIETLHCVVKKIKNIDSAKLDDRVVWAKKSLDHYLDLDELYNLYRSGDLDLLAKDTQPNIELTSKLVTHMTPQLFSLIGIGLSDEDILFELEKLFLRINGPITQFTITLSKYSPGVGHPAVYEQIVIDWIARQEKKSNSVYSCFVK